MFKFKKMIKSWLNSITILYAYIYDYIGYNRYNYNNYRNFLTKDALSARIMRLTHIYEKGLSLPSPRPGFGYRSVTHLVQAIELYISQGYSADDFAVQNSLNVLRKYLVFQHENNSYDDSVCNPVKQLIDKYLSTNIDSGVKRTSREEIELLRNKSYIDFFQSRHSVRQFGDEYPDFEKIRSAVELAKKSPTACNRQACKVYYYDSPEHNSKIGELIAGNTGFDKEKVKYLIITANTAAFYDDFERNQMYIESGIFGMGLVLALHYYGIASCMLQNGEKPKRDKLLKKISNIPESERVMLFIAIGNYRDEFSYAVSARKNLDEVLIVNE